MEWTNATEPVRPPTVNTENVLNSDGMGARDLQTTKSSEETHSYRTRTANHSALIRNSGT